MLPRRWRGNGCLTEYIENMMEKSIDVGGLVKLVLKGLRLGADELKALQKIGVREYLTTQAAKYDYVNTFLHRGDKVRFESIYYPLKISNGKSITNFRKPQEFLDKYKCIGIIGTAGSGKSTLVKYIFRQTLKDALKIPVLIELRDYNWEQRAFEDTVMGIITRRNVKPNPDILKRALKSGQFVFILDGFDEVYSVYKRSLLVSLDEFIDIYPDNNYIVTSRQDTGLEHFYRLKRFTICPLTEQGIIGFIRKTVSNKERRQRSTNISRTRCCCRCSYWCMRITRRYLPARQLFIGMYLIRCTPNTTD